LDGLVALSENMIAVLVRKLVLLGKHLIHKIVSWDYLRELLSLLCQEVKSVYELHKDLLHFIIYVLHLNQVF
jgi:hypothetical protein